MASYKLHIYKQKETNKPESLGYWGGTWRLTASKEDTI